MKPYLVVYYSRTGMTRKVAEQIAADWGCDLEPIREAHSRKGVFGFLRSAYEAMTHRAPPFLPTAKDPAEYQVVILGTPVWASHVSAPMRSYIEANKGRFHQVGAFCTMGGSGGDNALREVAELCGKTLVGSLCVTDADIESNRCRTEVDRFVQAAIPVPG